MTVSTFRIRLTSDAEPGTGLGSKVIDNVAPRDHWGRLVIRASHVKGLMRDALRDIAGPLHWDDRLVTRVFGQRDEGRPGVEAAVRLTDAVAHAVEHTALITRTAVDVDSGVAQDKTLRTTEAIAVDSVFVGQVSTAAEPDSVEDLAWRLGLLSIAAIGANRNRGSGACLVDIDGEARSPGELLTALHARRMSWQQPAAEATVGHQTTPLASSNVAPPVVLRLLFHAQTPVCCPEVADKTNVLSTGFRIPASAVQGAILNRLNTLDAALATNVFLSACFRAWPLYPCWAPGCATEAPPAALPTPIHVSLTHRVAKLSMTQELQARHFFDPSLDPRPYDWKQAVDGTPLKAADGVLLREPRGVRLWKASDMPHVITAHGVLNDPTVEDGRNLFTVDAMAPMLWQGLVVMPADAAERLQQSLAHDPLVAFGKSRSVRGFGNLRATPIEGIPPEWHPPQNAHRTVLIVQSPLLLPDMSGAPQRAEDALRQLAQNWANGHGLPSHAIDTWANVRIHFGWNRHAASDNSTGRQPACRVAAPGSVIAFTTRLDPAVLAEALQGGMGEGRQRGFGAVSVHPGTATGLYTPEPRPRVLSGSATHKDAVQRVLDIWHHAEHLPSPSQIRAVQQRLDDRVGVDKARAYLKHQTERTSRIWFTWEPIYSQIDELLSQCGPAESFKALELLADLAIASEKETHR